MWGKETAKVIHAGSRRENGISSFRINGFCGARALSLVWSKHFWSGKVMRL